VEHEELLDAILKKFEGNLSYTWKDFQTKAFYESLNSDYFVVENHLNRLIGDEVLKESNDPVPYISMTRKGWFVMTNPEIAGYVTQKKEARKKEEREKATLKWAKWATIFAAATIMTWIFDKLLKK